MTNTAITSPKERVWELDALRGLLILCVLATHLYFTVDAFCIDGIYKIDSYRYIELSDPLHFWFDWNEDGKIFRAFLTPDLITLWIRLGVDGFFVISGIACLLSRNNLRRGVIILLAAFTVSIFTKLLSVWTGDPYQFIRFGVLHCYGYCHIIYHFLLKDKKNKILLSIAVLIFIIGYFLRYNPVNMETALLYPFGIHEIGVSSRDYWPIFPMLGWMLCGVVLGRRFYSKKSSLFPTCCAKKWTRPLQFFGRHSGKIFFSHFFIYPAVFYGIGWIFNLL